MSRRSSHRASPGSESTDVPGALPAPPPDDDRSRRDYLDGVRGLSAFYVVSHHAWLLSATRFPIAAESGVVGFLTNWLLYGHLAVNVFIVLSGFCLILPVAADAARHNAVDFYLRRARRILPPYFAALVVSVLIFCVHNSAALGDATFWRNVGLHALLLQDVFNIYAPFNPPLWTIAVETHIYLLFPLLVVALKVLPPNRRYAAVLLGTAILGYGIVRAYLQLAPSGSVADLGHVCPWYVFLFGMGVCAGHLAAAENTATMGGAQKNRVAAFVLLLASVVGLCVLLSVFAWRREEADFARAYPSVDAVSGLATAVALYLLHTSGRGNIFLRVLSAKPLLFIGQFAYSLYLLHFPVLLLLRETVLPRLLPDAERLTRFWPMLLVGVPLAVVVSYAFFLFCEKPFLRRRNRSQSIAATEDKAAP